MEAYASSTNAITTSVSIAQSVSKAKSPIPIDTLIFHINTDLDGFVGRYLLVTTEQGECLFPGVSKAQARYVKDSPKMTDGQYDVLHWLPVDTGGGRLDEHKLTERLEGSCSTILTADYLEITDPVLRRICREVLKCDSKAGASSTGLAELVKLCNRCFPNKEETLWASVVLPALDAIKMQLTCNFAVCHGEFGIEAYFSSYVNHGFFKKEEIQTYVRGLVRSSAKRAESSVIELDFIVRAMHRMGKKKEDISAFVHFIFSRMDEDQIKTYEALDEINIQDEKYLVPAFMLGKDEEIRALIVQTDNPCALRAANMDGAHVSVILNSKGHCVISVSPSAVGLSIANLVAMVRWWEAPHHMRSKLDWERLKSTYGSIPEAPNWHYEPKHKRLMNGSKTHDGVEPTRLTRSDLRDIVKCAFNARRLNQWKDSHGVPFSPAPPREEKRPQIQPSEKKQ